MSRISKAVIPAAGRGTRMYPISRYIPKPMLPLGRKPVLQHIIDEVKQAGIEEIGLVVRSDHRAIWDYFEDQNDITFIEDDTTSGPGGAILKAEEFIDGNDFLVVFSDAPMRGSRLMQHLRKLVTSKYSLHAKAALSMYRIPKSEASSRGVIMFDEQNFSEDEVVPLTDIIEKPSDDENVSRWASTCRYVLDAEILSVLKDTSSDENGELQLTPAIRELIRQDHSVVGLPIPSDLQRYDTGNFEGYFEAFGDFAE